MGLIFIPKLTKKYFLFLAFTISTFIRDFTSLYDFFDYQKKGKNDKKFREQAIQSRHFDIITNVLADFLQGIFVLFNKIKTRKKSKNIIVQNFLFNDDKLSSKKNTKKNRTCSSFMKLMSIVCCIDYFCQLIFFYLCFNF